MQKRHELLLRAKIGIPNGLIVEVVERLDRLLGAEQLTKGS